MSKRTVLFILAAGLWPLAPAFAQTVINGGQTIKGVADNSGATHTLPMSAGTSVPGTCTVGELFFKTNATAGQNIYECQSTNVFTQQLNTGSSSGGGITMYSATGLTVTANTYYLPIGGGGSASTTETNVDIDSPAGATVTNLYVQLSVALGAGNSGVFTMRKNAASQSVTCTISGASATSCSDITHSFAASQGDLLTIQLVTTGTIVVTPNILIAAQFGNITATGTVNSGTTPQMAYYAATGTAVSGATFLGPFYCADAAGSGTTYTAASCTPFTPAAYTTGMTISFAPGTANTGASTLNINSLGAKSIVAANTTGSALVADDLLTGTGQVYTLLYDGTAFRKINGPSTAWTGLAYANSWADNGGGFQVGQYMKDNWGFVHVRGVLAPGTKTNNTTFWNMPAGYRPPTNTLQASFTDNGSTVVGMELEFLTSGVVRNNLTFVGTFMGMSDIIYSVY
jgi:hypothetical protein